MPGQLFGLSENPFGDGHDPRFVFHHAKRDELVALMRRRIAEGEAFITMTGDPGCGKTSVVSEVLESADLNARVAFVAHPSLTPSELLEAVCIEFGAPLPNPPSKPQALASLELHLRGIRRQGGRAVLVLDEAHGLRTESLEEIRLLSNMKADGKGLLQTLLVGVPELERRLGLPELALLRQRIAVHCRMAPLSPAETAGYLIHRVDVAGGNGAALYPDETCEEIHAYTNGFPRDINVLAGRALEHAEQEGAPCVSADHVRMAAGDARPGITTVQRPASGAPPELKRKVSPGRPAEAPRGPGSFIEPPAAPAPEVRRPPSFLSTPQAARTDAAVVTDAASGDAAAPRRDGPTLAERYRGQTPVEDPGRAGDPLALPMASESVQELGASVLLVALMVVALIASGHWNPVPQSGASPPVESAAGMDPGLPFSDLEGTNPGSPASAPLDPGTPIRDPARARSVPLATPAEPRPSAPARARHAYGFEVASSNSADSATAMLNRITRGSRLPCRIVAKSTGDAYRVVVGPFASRLEAQRAINELFRTTLVKRAQLVQIHD